MPPLEPFQINQIVNIPVRLSAARPARQVYGLTETRSKFSLTLQVGANDPKVAVDFLAQYSGLSRAAIKDVMNKGGVWLARGKLRRLRRANTDLRIGDTLELYYDKDLLTLTAPAARRLLNHPHYSLWFKPAGLLAQGTQYGDHCSILRQVEKALQAENKIPHLVHRLDREAAGIMLFAHTSDAAARLSGMFQDNRILKRYRIQVRGDLAQARAATGRITDAIDGKPAETEYRVIAHDPVARTSTVDIILHTGRLHQIRRHFDGIGHPVMGDPRYGSSNKNSDGMRLVATGLEFICPFSGKPVQVDLEPADIGFD
jgi:tRNA pseudouridine32 synthase/23S rRNA pseudouridine746 synthase